MERCGVVKSVASGEVSVEIERTSACAGCHAKASCLSLTGDAKETVKISCVDADRFAVGDEVKVKVEKGSARLSILLVYIVPLVVLVLTLVVSALAGISDDVAGVVTIVFLAIYYSVLYLFRGRVEKKMSFKIEK